MTSTLTELTNTIPHAVYRFFNHDAELIYVGLSVNPPHRFQDHQRHAAWWNEADLSRTTIIWFDSRTEAAHAELDAIRDERPKYNIVGRKGGGRRVRALSDEQKDILQNVVEEFEYARLVATQAWESLNAARGAGIPDMILCDRANVSVMTLTRNYGTRQQLAEVSA